MASATSSSPALKTRSRFENLGRCFGNLGAAGADYGCVWFVMKRTVLLLASSLALAVCSFAMQYSASRPAVLVAAVNNFQKVQAEFRVLDEPVKFLKSGEYSVSVMILSAQVQGRVVQLSAKGKLRGAELRSFKKGSRYRCLLSLSPTPAGERAGFKARCKSTPALLQVADPPNQVVSALRSKFIQNLRGVDEVSAGLVAGLAIGDVSKISQQTTDDMKAVSLTHLTAVSGANCAIVLAMFYLIVQRLGGSRWWRLGVGLGALVAYVWLVGAQPSVLRAAVMAGSVLVGISIGRSTAAMSALGLSVIFLLIADPWLAVDFGFALSVAATAGLLVLTQPITKRLQQYFPNWLAIAIGVSLAAQILCLPILLQLQQGLATYSLPANILAEPLVAPVTVLGILACALAWVFPPAAWALTYLASEATWVIARIANHFAGLDNVKLSWPEGLAGTAAAIAVVLGFLLWLKAEPTKLRNLGISTLSIIAAVCFGSLSFSLIKSADWPLTDWQVVACDVGQGDSLVIRSQNQIAVIDVGRENRPVDDCLRKLEVKHIDLLVLTHFDMDHIGGLAGALRDRTVGLALVSPFKDERWGATGTNLKLAGAGVRVIGVEKSMTGKLGKFDWLVLNPNRNAEGSEDSNDASIAMLWQSTAFNILTLADLGEKGQMRMADSSKWWAKSPIHDKPLILKVSHHGSADQFGELIEALDPDLSLISVGENNSYGHPTLRTIKLLASTGSVIQRTDERGSIAVASREGGLVLSNAPRG